MKFDEFSIGGTFTTNDYKVTDNDIYEFASEFDPQYIHIDKEKAEQGRFKGIIASGIHTLSLSFKLWVETKKYGEDIIAGTQMNNIKFIKPVFPNDSLHVVIKVIDKHSIKPDSGLLTVRLSTFNQDDDIVFKGELTALIAK
ncbi:MaoC family dehydratase [Staphylococcus succinus]|uniref:MaoC family dehydratase n=1 Tax=Staphylococcus succinus TaxID=61015 RepID=UPI002DB6746C|nr:MaoC family dehydratase [Staphylococcus succinus]MEB8127558.1 MaoC family dehydratase [Staphylococcus succinus]